MRIASVEVEGSVQYDGSEQNKGRFGKAGRSCMEHAHEGSKAAEKSAGRPPRRNPASPVSAGPGALLNLQRAAGNQAVARMLTSSASGLNGHVAGREPPATGSMAPITVQRNKLDEAIEEVEKSYGHHVDFLEFARTLHAKVNEPVRSPEATVSGQKTPTGTTATIGTAAATTTATPAALTRTKIPTTEELNKRSDMLMEQRRILTGKNLTDEQKKNLRQKENLDYLEKELAEKQELKKQQKELKDRATKLSKGESPEERKVRMEKERLDLLERRKNIQKQFSPEETKIRMEKEKLDLLERRMKFQKELSPEEMKIRDQNEELEVLEQEKKEKEERESTGRKRAMMARRLNPKKKSLSQLMGGRSL
jgi:hypothetical protein